MIRFSHVPLFLLGLALLLRGATPLSTPTMASVIVADPTTAQPTTEQDDPSPETTVETQAALNADENDGQRNSVQKDISRNLKPKITSMHVECNVSLRYAKTLVTSRVANPSSTAKEVTFSVVIPETAFITGFSMEIDGKVYEAYVKEKAEAKKVYQSAVSSGIAAAHVAVQARDSNHFTVSVNVEAESKAIFRLRYEELLVRRLNLYNLVMNLSPGQLLDDFSVDVNIWETSPITAIFVPSLRTGNEIDADPMDAPNEYSTHKLTSNRLHAKVHFSPNKTQQMELMAEFKKRHMSTTPRTSYPFIPYESRPAKIEEQGLKGQFVVQYDVERDIKGEVVLNDGYFVHFFAPKDLKPLNKHVIFVLDVSGSMIGRKISQLKEAMISILQDLNPGDYFNIIDFHYNAKVYNLDDPTMNAVFKSRNYFDMYGDVEEGSNSSVTPPPKPVTPENIAKAKKIIEGLQASGGTNIYEALTTALKVANMGIQEGELAPESDVKAPLPEPMVIFLTDGDPTVGEVNTDKILQTVKDLNPRKVSLFSLAFGEDADRGFLRRVALQNSGFMRHIYEAADAAHQLKHFYRQVASPLLANVTLIYPKDQIDEDSLTKKSFHYFFHGSELIIAGKTKNKEIVDAPIKLSAYSYDGPIDFIPIPFKEEKRTTFWPLERLWAYLSIKQLLDEKDSEISQNVDMSEGSPTKRALDLALKYSFVTPLTSLVVVKPNSTSAVDAESVDAGEVAPMALPQSISAQRFGAPMYSPAQWSNQYGAAAPSSNTGYSLISGSSGYPQASLGMPVASGYHQASQGIPVASDTAILQTDALEESQEDAVYGGSNIDRADSVDGTFEKHEYSLHLSTTIPPPHTAPPAPQPAPPAPPAPKPTQQDVVKEDNKTESRLALYGLEAFPWVEQYLLPNEDVISLPVSTKTKLTYKLKQKNLSYPEVTESPCGDSISGGPGVCQYLTDCKDLHTTFKNLTSYLNHLCNANGFAGICCQVDAP